MFLNQKKKAFSLVELMMILLVASLITAALFPVITKKHFRLPMLVNHGAYLCYYKEGKLREAKWAGKMKTKMLFDRETDNCVFVPPKKAGYFEISAIGGGGGGGDAGYIGGNWISTYSEEEMTPFDRTKESLKQLGISEQEFLLYAGYIIGYANSIGSGAGGDIGYMYRSDTHHTACIDYGTEEVDDWGYESICDAKWEDGKCHTYKCKDLKNCTQTPYTTTCTYTKPGYCAEQEPATTTKVYKGQKCTQMITPTPEYIDHHWYCVKKTTGGGCISAEFEQDASNQYSADVTAGTYIGYSRYEQEIRQKEPQCCDWYGCWEDVYEEETVPGKCKREVKDETIEYSCTKYNETCETKTEKNEVENDITSEAACNAAIGNKTWVKVGSHPESVCTKEDSYYTYAYNHDTKTGESGGTAAFCQSPRRAGDFGLHKSTGSNIYLSDVKKGYDLDITGPYPLKYYLRNALAGSGTVSCYPREDGVQRCSGSPSYSYIDITGNDETKNTGTTSLKAYSAAVGGNGAKRTIVAGDDVDPEKDYASIPSSSAENGTCSSGADSRSDCNDNKENSNGYCLVHHSGGAPELNGTYKYNFGLDINYLGYGEAGYPGEFKTKIVRSLKGIDTTIKVGRGGSAAALNSGGQGISGSETAFGDILVASGGSGGLGGKSQAASELPVYDEERYKKESICYYYDKAWTKDSAGNFVYNDDKYKNIRQKTTEEPNYCDGLKNQINNYKFFKLSNQNEIGNYPTPTGIFSSFLNLAFQKLTSGEESPLAKFTKYGRGGKGGGVEHRCWAGRGEVEFENVFMKSSVFVDQASATAHGSSKYVPATCRNDYSNIPAGPGADGAVLIKW